MKALAITPATIALDSSGVAYTLRKFESDTVTGFGKEAAIGMEVDEDQVFKTILFGDKKNGRCRNCPGFTKNQR